MKQAKLEDYDGVVNALVAESIECFPNSWTSATLTIVCDGNAINFQLKNPSEAENAQLSGELRGFCEDLYVVMRQNGDVWIEAIVDFFQKDDGWGFDIRFRYDNSSKNDRQRKEASKKPWWKIW